MLGALLESCFDDTGPTPSEAQRLQDHRERLAARAGLGEESRLKERFQSHKKFKTNHTGD